MPRGSASFFLCPNSLHFSLRRPGHSASFWCEIRVSAAYAAVALPFYLRSCRKKTEEKLDFYSNSPLELFNFGSQNVRNNLGSRQDVSLSRTRMDMAIYISLSVYLVLL
jgi:hypothetical protein